MREIVNAKPTETKIQDIQIWPETNAVVITLDSRVRGNDDLVNARLTNLLNQIQLKALRKLGLD